MKNPYISEDFGAGKMVTRSLPSEGPECCSFQRFVLDMRCAFEKINPTNSSFKAGWNLKRMLGYLDVPLEVGKR